MPPLERLLCIETCRWSIHTPRPLRPSVTSAIYVRNGQLAHRVTAGCKLTRCVSFKSALTHRRWEHRNEQLNGTSDYIRGSSITNVRLFVMYAEQACDRSNLALKQALTLDVRRLPSTSCSARRHRFKNGP